MKFKLVIVAGHEMVHGHCYEKVYLEVHGASRAGTLVLWCDVNFCEKPGNLIKLPD